MNLCQVNTLARTAPLRRGAYLVLWVALALGSLAKPGQSQTATSRLHARLTPGVVKLGGQAVLQLDIENAKSASVTELPEVDGLGFSAPGAPILTERSSLFKGRLQTSRLLSFSIVVRPVSVGEYSIPPLTIMVDGQKRLTPTLALNVVEDLVGADLGFMEVIGAPERVYEGETFDLVLQFGWDETLGASIESAGLTLPWAPGLPGLLQVERSDDGAALRNIDVMLNRTGTVTVEEINPVEREGRRFRTLRLWRRFVATRPGELEFGTSFLQFTQVIRQGVRTGTFSRQKDQVEAFHVMLPEIRVEVMPLPERGRPFEYSGAVGQFQVRSNLDRFDVQAGEPLELTVEWSGQGNLEFFKVPDPRDLEAFKDFRLYGQTEEYKRFTRRVTYHLAPVSEEIHEVPALSLSVFDTGKHGYETISTEPIPIRVRGLTGSLDLEEPEGAAAETITLDIRDIDSTPRTANLLPRLGAAPALGTAFGLPALAWLLRSQLRRRGGERRRRLRRRRRARSVLARELGRSAGSAEQLQAVYRYLGAKSDESPESWVGRDLSQALDESSATALQLLVDRMEAQTWNGAGAALDRDEVLRALDAVQLDAVKLEGDA